ncbi:MAG: UDP-N-acetylmuramoyl-L-alanyl-D-glutamate--2,6-diaminopimelate ligase [Spirochaetes bacterium]|nr:UDP-N-acetylmuramoyl-L-alanyl-D-glutamate--2,6-diaminopimelate ligase [Spirochaetota bacterium]
MKLKDLAEHLDLTIPEQFQSVPVKGIAYNSREIKKDFMFVAIKGFQSDGHLFLEEAIKKDASAVVVEDPFKDHEVLTFAKNMPVIHTPDNRVFLSRASSYFYNDPSLKLDLIGITGTNGKTTTSLLLEHIFQTGKMKTGLIGTIHYKIKGKKYPAPTTTPESLDLHRLLDSMVKQHIQFVPIEVSSHALKLRRVDDCHFKAAIFTNLTEDHFDFHKNYSDYFRSKRKLFGIMEKSLKKPVIGIINIDDRWGRKIHRRYKRKMNIVTYGIKKKADFRALDIQMSIRGMEFKIRFNSHLVSVRSSLVGFFNIYNILAAFACAKCLKIKIDDIVRALGTFPHPEGRMEIIKSKQFLVGIDYAHTDDALHNVLSSLRTLVPGRIITIFGCGGDRDRKKRPLMGKVAARFSDVVILTSDNPRTENPEIILDQIEKGIFKVRRNHYHRFLDRRQAIQKGISMARQGDFILVAGKGHEDYQIIGKKKIPFSDRKVVKEILNKM